MRNSKCVCNLAHVSLYAGLVLHHRRPANYLQVGNFCQIIQDFVLHTISEECVFGIGAQVLKGKYRDALSRRGSESPILDSRWLKDEKCRHAESDEGCGCQSEPHASRAP